MRKKSRKKVLPLEKCVKSFIFIVREAQVLVPESETNFFFLKQIAKARGFLNYQELDYDPF